MGQAKQRGPFSIRRELAIQQGRIKHNKESASVLDDYEVRDGVITRPARKPHVNVGVIGQQQRPRMVPMMALAAIAMAYSGGSR